MNHSMTVRRMYSYEMGDTHSESFELPLGLKDHAPPAAPFFATEHQGAVSYTFFRLPPKWIGEAHSAPFKCLVVCLAGTFRIVTSDGDRLVMRPGDKLVETATTGKGHITEVLSDEPVECLIVRLTVLLDEQQQATQQVVIAHHGYLRHSESVIF